MATGKEKTQMQGRTTKLNPPSTPKDVRTHGGAGKTPGGPRGATLTSQKQPNNIRTHGGSGRAPGAPKQAGLTPQKQPNNIRTSGGNPGFGGLSARGTTADRYAKARGQSGG